MNLGNLIEDSAVSTCAKPCFISFSPEFIEKMKQKAKIDPMALYHFLLDFMHNYRPDCVPKEVKENLEQTGNRFMDIGYRNLVCHVVMDSIIPNLEKNQSCQKNLVKALTRFNFKPSDPLKVKIDAFNKRMEAVDPSKRTTVADTAAGTVLKKVGEKIRASEVKATNGKASQSV